MTAVETTKERWREADINRMAGEIALLSSEADAAKAQEYLERALVVARKQQAKSWELRAAMSMARLKRDQGKRGEARDLLAPVYGWFKLLRDEHGLIAEMVKAQLATERNGFRKPAAVSSADPHRTSAAIKPRQAIAARW
jgi:predicted ATPase